PYGEQRRTGQPVPGAEPLRGEHGDGTDDEGAPQDGEPDRCRDTAGGTGGRGGEDHGDGREEGGRRGPRTGTLPAQATATRPERPDSPGRDPSRRRSRSVVWSWARAADNRTGGMGADGAAGCRTGGRGGVHTDALRPGHDGRARWAASARRDRGEGPARRPGS